MASILTWSFLLLALLCSAFCQVNRYVPNTGYYGNNNGLGIDHPLNTPVLGSSGYRPINTYLPNSGYHHPLASGYNSGFNSGYNGGQAQGYDGTYTNGYTSNYNLRQF